MLLGILRSDSWQKTFLKIKKFPHLYWDLNPQPLAYELYHKTNVASESEGFLNLCSTTHIRSFAIWKNVEYNLQRKQQLIELLYSSECSGYNSLQISWSSGSDTQGFSDFKIFKLTASSLMCL